MISYKRDVLERQSLSELKMGRGSPICERVRKKIMEYFKNNVPQCQIAKALQISSSTVHNIIKRFRETGEISVRKGQGRRRCWMPVVFGPSDDTASLIGMILSLILLNGPRNTSRNHCHLQMPTKALSCKKEAISKTIEYPRRVTGIVLNGEKCNAQYGRSIERSPAFWAKEPIANR